MNSDVQFAFSSLWPFAFGLSEAFLLPAQSAADFAFDLRTCLTWFFSLTLKLSALF